MDVRHWILVDGDRVQASGRVVATGDEVWFEPITPKGLPYCEPSQAPPPRPNSFGVPVDGGVDLTSLVDRSERGGGIVGRAELGGIWRRGRLAVDYQGPPLTWGETIPEWNRPPCPPPAGGWPAGHTDAGALDDETQARCGIVAVSIFRPGSDRDAIVIASTRPAEAEDLLRPIYGGRLCVVASRWTTAQIEAATGHLYGRMMERLVYAFIYSMTEEGQPVILVDMARVLPGFADAVVDVPDGLMQPRVWLKPVGRE